MDDHNSPEEKPEDKMDELIDSNAIRFEDFQDSYGETGEVMKRHLLCALCGGHLHFTHMPDFKLNLVQETAKCPDCGIRIRQRIHKLQ